LATIASLPAEEEFQDGEHARAREDDGRTAHQQFGSDQPGTRVHVIGKNRAQADQRVRKHGEHEEADQQCPHRRCEPGGSGDLVGGGEPQHRGGEIEPERNERERRPSLQPPLLQTVAGATKMAHAPEHGFVAQRGRVRQRARF
jgi:hypothetical protein